MGAMAWLLTDIEGRTGKTTFAEVTPLSKFCEGVEPVATRLVAIGLFPFPVLLIPEASKTLLPRPDGLVLRIRSAASAARDDVVEISRGGGSSGNLCRPFERPAMSL